MSNQVARIEEQRAPAVAQEPASESTAIVQMIERAASNPAVDIDKMERLLQMQERVMERRAQQAYAASLALLQSELPVIRERGVNTNTKAKYALWEDVNEQIRPHLGKHGFSLSFRVETGDAKVNVTGVLTHRDGHREETTLTLPIDAGAGRNAVQAHGSSVTYGKRYTAAALLNLTSRESEDDDGNAAGIQAPISDEQLQELRSLADEVGADLPRFCRHMKVDALAKIPASQFQAAKDALEAKRGRK